MAYFTSEFNTFFKTLAANNHKDWFDENRKTYHEFVKDPFYAFLKDLISEISKFQPLDLEVKNAVFRINNDIRFNKEKPLYKLHVGASIVNGGRKNFNDPGFYIQLSPGDTFIASGVYKPDKDRLQSIRNKIAGNVKSFQKLYNDESFIDSFGGFAESTVNKVLPKEFKEMAIKEPFLYNQQFYYVQHFDKGEELILRDDLLNVVMDYYQSAKKMNDFLKNV